MKMKTFLWIVVAVAIGIFLGNMLYKQYDETMPVLNISKEYYFLTAGTFDSLEELQTNTVSFKNYAYENVDGKLKVVIAVTANKENIEKIKGLYQDKANIIVETRNIPSNAFTEVLKEYDKLLQATNDKASMETIIKQVLEKYKEL